MLTTYTRILQQERESLKMRTLKARLERRVPRDAPRDERHIVPSLLVALIMRRAESQ